MMVALLLFNEDVKMRNLDVGGFANPSEFKTFIVFYIRRTWDEAGDKMSQTRECNPSASWLTKKMQMFLPETSNIADKQYKARLLNRLDVSINLQQAAVAYASMMGPTGELYPYDKRAVCPDLYFNIDAFSMKLQDSFLKGRSRSALGAKASAKETQTNWSKRRDFGAQYR